jgi:Ca-activated chloride channel family protein
MKPVVLLLLGLAAVPMARQQPLFKSGVDVVSLDVSVRDGGKVISGMSAPDFALFDNGVPQDIADLSYGKLPNDVTVALDISYSVTGAQLGRLRLAVAQLMKDLGPEDRLRLMLFNERVHRAVDFTTDVRRVEDAIVHAAPGGATSVFDALSVSLVSAEQPDRRQLVVLFTDGIDSMSFTEPRVLIDLARHTNVTLSAVLPDMSVSGLRVRLPAMATEHLKVYKQLSADTGGVIVPLPPGANLTSTFAKALDEFRSSYVLHFSPRGSDAVGFHELTVTVPARPKLTVRARKGYWKQ